MSQPFSKNRALNKALKKSDELSTLKAQLAQSEQRERELRELLVKSAEILEWGQRGIAFSAEPRKLFSRIKAALRSAPPVSLTGQFEYGPQDSPSRSQWISVEERLPEFADHRTPIVLAYGISGAIFMARCVRYPNGSRAWRAEAYANSVASVTHWQPLPAPPSRASEKENRNE